MLSVENMDKLKSFLSCHISIPHENVRKKFSDVFRGYRNVTLD